MFESPTAYESDSILLDKSKLASFVLPPQNVFGRKTFSLLLTEFKALMILLVVTLVYSILTVYFFDERSPMYFVDLKTSFLLRPLLFETVRGVNDICKILDLCNLTESPICYLIEINRK
jgi:hypothetical protein